MLKQLLGGGEEGKLSSGLGRCRRHSLPRRTCGRPNSKNSRKKSEVSSTRSLRERGALKKARSSRKPGSEPPQTVLRPREYKRKGTRVKGESTYPLDSHMRVRVVQEGVGVEPDRKVNLPIEITSKVWGEFRLTRIRSRGCL